MIMFGGQTFEEKHDGSRLRSQLNTVYRVMVDMQWRTLEELVRDVALEGIVASEAGVSARLRDLRKPKFGGHTVERMRAGGGLFRYRLLVNQQ